jgi:hypothetical protein
LWLIQVVATVMKNISLESNLANRLVVEICTSRNLFSVHLLAIGIIEIFA